MNPFIFIFGILLIFSSSAVDLIFAQTEDCRSMGERKICDVTNADYDAVKEKLISHDGMSAEQRKIINNFVNSKISTLQPIVKIFGDTGYPSESQRVLNRAASYYAEEAAWAQYWEDLRSDRLSNEVSSFDQYPTINQNGNSGYSQPSWNSRSTNNNIVSNNPSNANSNYEINVAPFTFDKMELHDTTLKINQLDAVISQNNNFKNFHSPGLSPTIPAKWDAISSSNDHLNRIQSGQIKVAPVPPITVYVTP